MNHPKYDRAFQELVKAGAEAIGMLEFFDDYGQVEAIHRDAVVAVRKRYRTALNTMNEAIAEGPALTAVDRAAHVIASAVMADAMEQPAIAAARKVVAARYSPPGIDNLEKLKAAIGELEDIVGRPP